MQGAIVASIWDAPAGGGAGHQNMHLHLESQGTSLFNGVVNIPGQLQADAGRAMDAVFYKTAPAGLLAGAKGAALSLIQEAAMHPSAYTHTELYYQTFTSSTSGLYYIASEKLTAGQLVFARRQHVSEIKAAAIDFTKQAHIMQIHGASGPGELSRPVSFMRIFTLPDLNAEMKTLQDHHYAFNAPQERSRPRWKTAQECLAEVPVVLLGVVVNATRLPWDSKNDVVRRYAKSKMMPFTRAHDALWSLQIQRRGLAKDAVINLFDNCIYPGTRLFAVLQQRSLDYATCVRGVYPRTSLVTDIFPTHQDKFGIKPVEPWRVDPYVYDDVTDSTVPIPPDRSRFIAHISKSSAVSPVPSTSYWQWTLVSAGNDAQAVDPAQYILPRHEISDANRLVDLAYIDIGYYADGQVSTNQWMEDCTPDSWESDATDPATTELVNRAKALRWRYAVQYPPTFLDDEMMSVWLEPSAPRVVYLDYRPINTEPVAMGAPTNPAPPPSSRTGPDVPVPASEITRVEPTKTASGDTDSEADQEEDEIERMGRLNRKRKRAQALQQHQQEPPRLPPGRVFDQTPLPETNVVAPAVSANVVPPTTKTTKTSLFASFLNKRQPPQPQNGFGT